MSDSAIPRAVALQAPLPMECFRQEYWSGLPFPSRLLNPNWYSGITQQWSNRNQWSHFTDKKNWDSGESNNFSKHTQHVRIAPLWEYIVLKECIHMPCTCVRTEAVCLIHFCVKQMIQLYEGFVEGVAFLYIILCVCVCFCGLSLSVMSDSVAPWTVVHYACIWRSPVLWITMPSHHE